MFLNGLMGTQTVWNQAVENVLLGGQESLPPLLTYDRYGQGESARDPTDESEFGHGLPEVVADLHDLIEEIWKLKAPAGTGFPKVIFVANSIGCVVGRYFAQTYPGTTSALLFLDSNIANSDQVSLFPDPDALDFNPDVLPRGITVDQLRETREKYRELFHPSVRNDEGLDRRNIAALLPYADKPPLIGTGELRTVPRAGPWIAVVGHDPEKFAEDSRIGKLHAPKALTNTYVNPVWAEYNEGLLRLTDAHIDDNVIIAEGCGHFIQTDDPSLVSRLVTSLVIAVEKDLLF